MTVITIVLQVSALMRFKSDHITSTRAIKTNNSRYNIGVFWV